MTSFHRDKVISLKQEALEGIISLGKQAALLFAGLLIMLLITKGNPSETVISCSFIIGIISIAWLEKKRLSKLVEKEVNPKSTNLQRSTNFLETNLLLNPEPIMAFLNAGFKAFSPEDKQQPLVVIDQKAKTQPVRFGVTFEPMDDETFEDLDEDQPVVVFIYDPYEPEEFIYVVTELGQGINNGELYPGTYALVALVYLDEDFDEIDGVGTATFNIYEGELPFDLTVPISSDDEIISNFLAE